MTQTLLKILMPTLMVLIGIFSDRKGWARINASISSLEKRLDARIGGFEQRLDAAIAREIGTNV